MNLIGATLVLAVLIIIVLLLLYFVFYPAIFEKVTESQAVSLVLNDLQKNSTYTVTLDNVSASQYAGSWHIVVSVVINATSPCPGYYIYAYDYPKFGFEYTVLNNYTESCIVNGYIPGKPFRIGSYPVAIAWTTSRNISSVVSYLKTFGYANVSVRAKFYNVTKLDNKTYDKVWLVNYAAAGAKHYVNALVSGLNGTVEGIFNST
ncbi:MAG: hypothetical protein ACP5T3_03200 [Candidatus Micrarchaeia archaeon]